MKLRNKQTGEIVVFGGGVVDLRMIGCANVAEMIEAGWEDYEEPKPQVVYYIDRDGRIVPYKNIEYPKRIFNAEQNKEIGNYFETREEAEKAVEKLKAYKRLKDKGFRFEWWKEADNRLQYNTITFNNFVYNYEDREQLRKDLDLLFGGEE